jgi:hypothetical protein
MDSAPLLALLDRFATTPNHLLHGLVLVRHEKLVFEHYWPGIDLEPGTLDSVARAFDRETLHYVASVSKSITSTLVGIARDRGLIGGVQDSLFTYFPDRASLETVPNRAATVMAVPRVTMRGARPAIPAPPATQRSRGPPPSAGRTCRASGHPSLGARRRRRAPRRPL